MQQSHGLFAIAKLLVVFMLHVLSLLAMCTIVPFSVFLMCVCRILIKITYLPETRKFDHITPVMRELHWLPIRKRIDTNWRWWSTSVCMDWRLLIWLLTVCLSHHWRADISLVLWSRTDSSKTECLWHWHCSNSFIIAYNSNVAEASTAIEFISATDIFVT